MVQLAGTAWAVAEHDHAEIAFDVGGTVSGSTGVNRFHGQYLVHGDRLTVGPLATTRMAGSPEAMRREQSLLDILAQPLRLAADGEAVVLSVPMGPGDGATPIRLVRRITS